MSKTYYFISDLHIGGDGALDHCEFEHELVEFLRALEHAPRDSELIVVGDLFGLWETAIVEGPDKLHVIIANHHALFMQFRRTSEKVRISVLPGNHDHELAGNPEFARILSFYGFHLEARPSITREIAGRTLWIEHGHQHDSYNRIEEFGNPLSRPVGYYFTRNIVSGASTRAKRSADKWLKDIESVYPTEHVPFWLFSNYFYREMNWLIQLLVLPFLLLFTTSAVMVGGTILESLGAVRPGRFFSSFSHSLGWIGYLLDAIFLVDGAAIAFLLLISIPVLLIRRDIANVFTRYQFDFSEALKAEKKQEYLRAAEEVFRSDPNVALFVYGHTHAASLERRGDRVILNTGAWLKKLTCITSRFYLLPAVYRPSYQLGYFEVTEENGQIAIRYHRLFKEPPHELSLLQRISVYGKQINDNGAIPAEVMIPVAISPNEKAIASDEKEKPNAL